MKLQREKGGMATPFFTPYRTEAVTGSATFTPKAGDLAFKVNVDCTIAISGGTAAACNKGDVFGVYPDATYVPSVNVVLFVM